MARTKLQTPNCNLNRRADGYYDIRYTDPTTGKLAKKATGTKDPNEAEKERARFAQEYKKPKLSARPTVSELCDAYMAYRTPRVASPESLPYSYNPLKRRLGHLFADSITQTVVDGYAKDRAEEAVERAAGRYGSAPVGEATINKELSVCPRRS